MNNAFQMIQNIRNPQNFINQVMNNSQILSNPMAKNALSMYQKGDMNGLQNMAENLCREKGTTIEEVKNKLLSQFNIN